MSKIFSKLITTLLAASLMLAPVSVFAADEAALDASAPSIEVAAEEASIEGDEILEETEVAEETGYVESTISGIDEAKKGIVQINCVYIDDDNKKHIVKGGTGFLIGTPSKDGQSGAQYVVTAISTVTPSKDTLKAALRSFGVKKAELEDKMDKISYEVVVTKDIATGASLYKSSEQLDMAVFSISETYKNKIPLSIFTSNDGKTHDLPYEVTDTVYLLGFPDTVSYDGKQEYYTNDEVTMSSGKIVNLHTMNDNFVITHDGAVAANNCGGPLVNADGNVIGLNVMRKDGEYNVAIDSTEIIEILDSFGMEYNKLTPDTMKPEVVETPEEPVQIVQQAPPQVIVKKETPKGLYTAVIVLGIGFGLILAALITLLVLQRRKDPEVIKAKQQKKEAKEEKKKREDFENPIKPFVPAPVPTGNAMQNGGVGMETSVLGHAAESGTSLLGQATTKSSSLSAGTLLRKNTGDNIVICKDTTIIGKDSLHVDYCIRDNSAISRTHAIIHAGPQGVSVEDAHSTNGTFVNDRRLGEGEIVPIKKGDVIRLGNEEFEYRN